MFKKSVITPQFINSCKFHFLTRDLISAVIFCLLGLMVWWWTREFPDLPKGYPGPKLFPRVIGAGLIFVAVILGFQACIISSGISLQTRMTIDRKGAVRSLTAVGFVAFIPLMINNLGFISSLGFFCFCLAMMLRIKIWKGLLLAVTTVGIIYLLFTRLLSIPL